MRTLPKLSPEPTEKHRPNDLASLRFDQNMTLPKEKQTYSVQPPR